jgi:DNA mismatch endonuclease (patch repair protein)
MRKPAQERSSNPLCRVPTLQFYKIQKPTRYVDSFGPPSGDGIFIATIHNFYRYIIMADVHGKETRSYNMSRIKNKNTKIEIVLSKALWAKGYRYTRNDKSVIGKPDFVFKKIKLAVFCDSEFWHGKDWDSQQKRMDTNKEYWISKIQNNINRDKKANEKLTNSGWVVVRFWETEIKKNLNDCVLTIIDIVNFLR